MKQSLLTLILGVSVTATSFMPAAAQDTGEVIFKVTTAEEYAQCTATVYDYDRDPAWDWYNYSGGYIRLWYYNSSSYGPYLKDYLTTPELQLEKGVLYKVELTPISYTSGTSNAATIDLLMGQGDDPREFTTLASYSDLPYIGTPNSSHVKSEEFAVQADGAYRISLLGKQKFAKVYNFQVIKLGQSSRPEGVSGLTATPDAAGATQVAVTFTLPSQTITGQNLSGELSYTISRDGVEVNSATAQPGTPVNWTDTSAPEGTVKYTVRVSQNGEVSQAAEVSTFVGLETPAAPGSPAYTSADGVHTVTWETPAGIHGINLDASSLVYTVSRVLNGNAEELGTVTGQTTYTDNYVPSRPVLLSYAITATNGTKVSAAAETPAVKIGHVDLPFADSFADGSFGGAWDVEATGTVKTYNWKPFEKFYVGRYGSSADILPVDGDGGLAGFEGYSANASNQSRLVTAPISKSSSAAPVVEFWFHHDNGSSKANEGVKLQVSNDNGEWIDVADSHILRYTTDTDKLGWQKYVILLGDALADDCTTYRVGFLTVNEYGNNMAIDAVRIFNAVENDLQVSLNGPTRMVSGSDVTLTVTVANNGSTPVAASAYMVNLASDLGVEFDEPELVDIAPLSSVNYDFTFALDAGQASAAPSYTFTAQAPYANDAVPENNTSSPLVITTAFADHSSVEGVQLESGEDGKKLSWDAAGTPGYSPLLIEEGFEDAEMDATDNINGFTILDLDESSGSIWYMCSGSKLNVFHPNSTLQVSGQNALGVTVGSYTRQNDWLISPVLSAADISTFDFSFKIGFKESSYSHDFEVLYATEDFDPENPKDAFTLIKKETTSSYGTDPVKCDNKLHSRKYTGIPADAKYVAIHLNSYLSYGSAMWIDDIVIAENNPAPLLGYNVYQVGVGRLNAEMLSSSELSFALESVQLPADGSDPSFFVTAVYPDGETAPSEAVVIALPKAPRNVAASLAHDVFSGKNDITVTWEAPEDAADDEEVNYVVSFNGVQVAETTTRSYLHDNAASQLHNIEVKVVKEGLPSPAASTTLEIKDEDYASLTVRVTSNNGYLPEEYNVVIADKDNTDAQPWSLAHSDNAVEIGYLPVGNYTATVHVDGFKPWSEDVELNADHVSDAALEEYTTVPFGLSVTHQDGESGHEYLFKWNEEDPMENIHNMWRVVDYTVSLDGETYADHVDGTSLIFTGVEEGEHTAGVRANYVSGPTDEATVKFLGLSGVNGLKTLAEIAGLTGAIRIGVDGQAAVTVYNAAGVAVASASMADETVMIPASQGVYLVVVNGSAVKVAVK